MNQNVRTLRGLRVIVFISVLVLACFGLGGVCAATAEETKTSTITGMKTYGAAIACPETTDAVVALRNLGPGPQSVTIEWWSNFIRPIPSWAHTYVVQPGETLWHYFQRAKFGIPGQFSGLPKRFKAANFSLHVNTRGGEWIVDGLFYDLETGFVSIMNLREVPPYSIPLGLR